jgi:hypothetical protein
MVMLTIDETPILYRYEMGSSTTKQMSFRRDVVATKDKDLVLRKQPNTLRVLDPQKVTVDPIGRIRTAGD